jgi:hypothetical protein
LGLGLTFRAPAFGHLTTKGQPRFGVGDECGEAALAGVAVGDVAFEVVSCLRTSWHGIYHI